jgi:membrane protease YdiL (CAAX protease family)
MGRIHVDKGRWRSEIALFLGLIIFLTILDYIWMFGSGTKNSPTITVALMMGIPGLAALSVVALRRIPLAELGWRAGKLRYWGLALAFPILVSLIAYGSMWLSGATEFTRDVVANYRWIRMLGFKTPAPFYLGIAAKGIFASLMALPFVLGEEIGWSGFLAPRLRKRLSIPATSIVVGLFWSFWHYPAIIGGLYGSGSPLWMALPGFTLALTGASFFRTILVWRSQSLWPGVILHVSHNVFLMGMFYEMTRKSTYSARLVSESGLFLGTVYLVCGILYYYFTRKKAADDAFAE